MVILSIGRIEQLEESSFDRIINSYLTHNWQIIVLVSAITLTIRNNNIQIGEYN